MGESIPRELRPLYEDPKIVIRDYDMRDPEAHVLYFVKSDKEYLLQRGILKEFAQTPRGNLEIKLQTVNPLIIFNAREENLEISDLHLAFCQAYIEESERRRVAEAFHRLD